METLVKADIFFFVTTVVVAVLGILAAVALAYVVTILHGLRDIVRTTRREVNRIAADVSEAREDLKERLEDVRDMYDDGKGYASAFAGSANVRRALSFLVSTFLDARHRGKRKRAKE